MILLALLTSVNANPNYARCSTPIQPGDSMMRATIQPGAATFTWSRGGKALACNSNYQPGETLTGVLSGPRADTQALWVAEGGATLQFEAGALRGGIPNCETTRVYTLEGWDAGVVSARMPASGGIKLHAIYARIAVLFRTRLGPSWYKWHIGLQLVALLVIAAGFGVAIAIVEQKGGSHFTGVHESMGLALFLLVLVQIAIALVRHLLTHRQGRAQSTTADGGVKDGLLARLLTFGRQPAGKSVPQMIWVALHKWFALSIFALSIAQLVTGITMPASGGRFWGLWYVFFFLFGGAGLALAAGLLVCRLRGEKPLVKDQE